MKFEVLNNDFAMDVKNSYIAKLKQGKNDSVSLEEVLTEYAEEQTDEDLRLTFWMSLAMVMWEYGRLTEEVKNKTNTELELALDLIIDDEKKDYLEIKEQYNSTMSERKRVSVHKPYRTGWNVGDIYSFQIQDSIKGYEKYIGWYAIIYINKLFLEDWYVDGIEDEIAEAYFFLSAEEPVDENVIDVSKNVCFFCSKNGNRYRVNICETTKRNRPKDLKYVGNRSNIVYPSNDTIDSGTFSWIKSVYLREILRGYERQIKCETN